MYELDLPTKIKFLGQGVQKFDHEQDRQRHAQADATETPNAFAGDKINNMKITFVVR